MSQNENNLSYEKHATRSLKISDVLAIFGFLVAALAFTIPIFAGEKNFLRSF